MERPHSDLLRKIRQRLIENIEIKFSPLWDHLVGKNVISQGHVTQMKVDFRSNSEQVGEFIDYLTRRPHRDYLAFREALMEADQGHVVQDLLPKDGQISSPKTTGGFDTEPIKSEDALATPRIPVFTLPHTTHSASAKAIRDIRKKIRDLPSPTDCNRCTQKFKMDKERSERCYVMRHDVRGRALVVTMTGDRQGWEVDVIKVAELMKYLDIDTQFKFDLKHYDLARSLEEFAKSDENSYVDCAWVVFMGHGNKMNGEDYLGTADAKTFFIRKEMEVAFDNNKCLGLRGKPKIILVQMCRGEALDIAIDPLGKTQPDSCPPRHAPFEDYIISYATQPGKKAMRNTVEGSWYISRLVDVFKALADHTAVPEMLEEVHRRVRSVVTKDEQGRAVVQTAEATSSLTRRLYLFPRVYEDDKVEEVDATEETSGTSNTQNAQATSPTHERDIEELKKELAALRSSQTQAVKPEKESEMSVTEIKDSSLQQTEEKVLSGPDTDTAQGGKMASSVNMFEGKGQDLISEDNKVQVDYSDNWLQVISKDPSRPAKRVVSGHKLRAVTHATPPTHVHVIKIKLVNLGLCCHELFRFASLCVEGKKLSIYDTKDNTPGNRDIISGLEAALPHLKQLRYVDIRCVPMGPSGGRVLAALRSPQLRYLCLWGNQLGGCGPQLAACLQALPSLAVLDLINSALTGEEMPEVLSSLATSCPLLVALLLGDNDLSLSAAPLAQAVHNHKLKVLTISNGKLNSNQIVNITKNMSGCIEFLGLHGNAVCTNVEKDLISLVESHTELWYITLWNSQVSGDAWRRMEKAVQGRGGCLHERLGGSEDVKRGDAYLDKINAECLNE